MNIIWFDFDGTIIHVEERFYRVHQRICEQLALPPLDKEQYWNARINGVSTKDILKLINAEHLFEEYISIRNALLESLEFLKYDRLRSNAKIILDDLHKNYQINLLTARSNEANLLLELEQLDIKKYFTDIFIVSPFSKWVDKSAILSKYTNESICMIGDTPNDIIAANKVAIKTIGILNGMSTKSIISSCHPDFIVNDFYEVKAMLSLIV